eukprot:c15489_g1_i1 orf=238-795(-)
MKTFGQRTSPYDTTLSSPSTNPYVSIAPYASKVKTSPTIIDTAWGKLSQGTKVLMEGGSESAFRQTFHTSPNERLHDSFACFLSTTAGPIAGQLFVSTNRVAFLSDQPLPHNQSSEQDILSYYKVMVPLDKIKVVNASKNPKNSSEKYLQVITNDHHEFWFMGFVSYEKALKVVQEAKVHSFQPK